MKCPVLLQSSNAVALNCDFHTLFFLSGFSAVRIWFTALLNYNSVNANYFQLSSDQFSELFPGCWQHDRLCCIDASKFKSRSQLFIVVKLQAFFAMRLRASLWTVTDVSAEHSATICLGSAPSLPGYIGFRSENVGMKAWVFEFWGDFHCLSTSFRYLVRTPTFYHSGDSTRLDVTRLRRPAARFNRGTFVDGGNKASHAGRLIFINTAAITWSHAE
jgi:hypothetical protein